MFRLAVVACLVLGAAPAQTTPLDESKNSTDITPFDVDSEPYQDKPQPITLDEGSERRTITLRPGRHFFQSRNYPRYYTNNFNSRFSLRGNRNQRITIICRPFSMEWSRFCRYDYLAINGRRYCGCRRSPRRTASRLHIRIRTDRAVVSTGFRCYIYVPGRWRPRWCRQMPQRILTTW